LHYLPFQALVYKNASAKDGLHYLVEKYAIVYTPSMTILDAIQKSVAKRTENPIHSLLAVASPSRREFKDDLLGGEIVLEKLEFAKGEALDVASLYTDKEIFTDEKATETIVKDKAPKFGTILFSTHACLIPHAPLKSFVFFDADQSNDGKLTIEEIENMKLNADMIVLSACETGLVAGYEGVNIDPLYAQFPLGDDLVGLQRAFMKSGASSVVSTLWSVADESTAQFIKEYFRLYRDGKSKVSAMRSAQLALLHSSKYSEPFFWAPFIISGKAN